MDPNEFFKFTLFEQAPKVRSSVDALMAGLGNAGQTVAQDAGFLSGVLNDPRNSWIGNNPLGRAGIEGLALIGALRPFFHGTTLSNAQQIMQQGFRPTARNAEVGGGVFFGSPGTPGRTSTPLLYAMHGSDAEGSAFVKGLIDDNKLVDVRHDLEGWGGDLPANFQEFKQKWQKQGKVGVMTPNETIVWDTSAIQPEKVIPLFESAKKKK